MHPQAGCVFRTVPKLLLLSGTPPGRDGVGALYLREICRAYPAGKLSCFAAIQDGSFRFAEELSSIPLQTYRWPYDQASRSWPGRIGSLQSAAAFEYSQRFRSTAFRDAALHFAKAQRVDMIWAILDTPIMYRVAVDLAERLDLPLITTVWDPPDGVCRLFGLDRLSRRGARVAFERVLRRSLRCGVMSEAMKEEYESRFGVECVVVRHAPAESQRASSRREQPADGPVRIGFCGSLYAAAEWIALQKTLEQASWRLQGRDVQLRVLGPSLRIYSSAQADVEFLGWRSTDETIRLLADCDLGYLPYWFDPAFCESVRLCFPTKLSAYLASGLVVFYHGPKDASPPRFFERYPAAVCCHSLDPMEIRESLESGLSDPASMRRRQEAGQHALDEELNLNVFFRRFAQLAGCSLAALAAAPSNHEA